MKKELKRPTGKELYATLTLEKQNDLIFLDWNGYLNLDLVKAGSEELLVWIKQHKVTKVLVDNSKVSGTWQAANSWYETDWNPRAAKEGLAFMAIIMSDNVFTQLSAQGFVKVTKGLYTVNIFNGASQARAWLAEQKAAAVAK